jgi:methyl-accepting chemotaxis protein
MTVEERFERIEHVTAGLAEERRKDREEFRALWRDTQRQLNDITLRVAAVTDALDRTGDRIAELAEESRAADQRLAARIEETDKRLGARIDTMISALGQYLAQQQKPQGS